MSRRYNIVVSSSFLFIRDFLFNKLIKSVVNVLKHQNVEIYNLIMASVGKERGNEIFATSRDLPPLTGEN